MKKYIIPAAIALILASSCAKNTTTTSYSASLERFNAWMQVYYPGLEKAAGTHGIYVLDESAGTGAPVGDEDSCAGVIVNFTTRELYTGLYTSTTSAAIARQINGYDTTGHYAPVLITRSDNGQDIGVEDMIRTMNVGGKKTAIIPGWLQTTGRYDTEAEYLSIYESGDPLIYNMEVLDTVCNITRWERNKINNYVGQEFPQIERCDTNFYYVTIVEGDSTSYTSSDGFWIQYTGRVVDGKVFDTNVEKVAKDNGFYDASSSYSPMYITRADEESDVKMGSSSTATGSSVITGFARGLLKMHPYESCTIVFTSDLGYGTSGSGVSIPANAPLRFDITIVDAP